MANTWQRAAEPVGDAKTSEYGFVTGSYEACMFTRLEMPQSVFDGFVESESGEATWGNVKFTWGLSEDGEDFLTTLTLVREVAQPTTTQPAPTTTQPASTTTQPAPTTTQPAPTTTQPAPTTTQPAPTTTNTVAPTDSAVPADLPPAPAPTIAVPTGGPVTPDQGVSAQQCYDGLMDACDDLYVSTLDAQDNVIAGLEAYKDFADSCAGRQAMNSGTWCVNRFASTNAAPPAPDGTEPATPAPAPESTTTQPAPVNQPANAVQGAHEACVPLAVADWFANRDKSVHPGSAGQFQVAANSEGVSLNDFVEALVASNYDSATGGTRIVSPWEGYEEGSDLSTESGLLMGLYFGCMIETLALPEAILDDLGNSGGNWFRNSEWSPVVGTRTGADDSGNTSFVIRFSLAVA